MLVYTIELSIHIEMQQNPTELNLLIAKWVHKISPNSISSLRHVSQKWDDLVTEEYYAPHIRSEEHHKLVLQFIECIRAGNNIVKAVDLFIELLREPQANQTYQAGDELPSYILNELTVDPQKHSWAAHYVYDYDSNMQKVPKAPGTTFSFGQLVNACIEQERVHDLATAILLHKDIEVSHDTDHCTTITVMKISEFGKHPWFYEPERSDGVDYDIMVSVSKRKSMGLGGWKDILFCKHKSDTQWVLPPGFTNSAASNITRVARQLLTFFFRDENDVPQRAILRASFTDTAVAANSCQ